MNRKFLTDTLSLYLYSFFYGMFTFLLAVFGMQEVWPVASIRGTVAVGTVLMALLVIWTRQSVMVRLWSFLGALALLLAVHLLVGFETMAAYWMGEGLWCLVAAGLVLGSFLVWSMVERFVILQALAAGSVVGVFVYWMAVGYSPSQMLIALLSVYIFYLACSFLRKRRKREFMALLFPVFVLYVLLLAYSPVSDEPYSWSYVKRFISFMEEQINNLTANSSDKLKEDFQMGMGTLSDELTVRGNVGDADVVFMHLKTVMPQKSNLYLTGAYFADFDGMDWEGRTDALTDDGRLDTLETMLAVGRVTDNLSDYLDTTALTVEYGNFHSAKPFGPAKSWSSSEPKPLFGENWLGYGTSYECHFYQMNRREDYEMDLLLAAENTEADEELFEAANRRMEKNGTYYTWEELLAYREELREIYQKELALSAELTDTMAKLTDFSEEELAGFGGSENLKKYMELKRLEHFFGSMQYTRTPSLDREFASDADFLDYLIFEKQSGYCTHFATAFVLLARHLGMPARLCQGFLVDMKGAKETQVVADMAHAWPEVYFEGVGWLAFEPTPGYGEKRYSSWSIKRKAQNQVTDWSDYYAYLESIHKPQERPAEPVLVEEESFSIKDGLLIAAKLLLAALVFVLLGVCMVAAFYARKIWLYRHMSLQEQYEEIYRRNLLFLDKLGYRQESGETLREFEEMLLAENKLPRLRFLELRAHVLYGKAPVTEAILRQTRADGLAILEYGISIKKHKRRFRMERILYKD